MTNWTLETLEDFDGVRFDDGTGWKVLFEIHLALSLRIQMVSSAYGSPFATQISGLMWTQDGPGGSAGELSMELTACYNAIVSLLGGPVTEFGGLRWTEASGRSPEWTIESLTADIGMGEFADLIVRSQRPEPLVWLIAAISRLQYPKIYRRLYFNDLVGSVGDYAHEIPSSDMDYGLESAPFSGTETSRMQEAWTALAYNGSYDYGTTSVGIGWSFVQLRTIGYQCKTLKKLTGISLAQKLSVGDTYYPSATHVYSKPLSIKCLDYEYRIATNRYDGPNFVVQAGSSGSIDIGKTYTPYGTLLYIESASDDLDFEGTKSISLELVTARPATVPFLPYTLVLNSFNQAYITMSMPMAWVYCDLPQIMGVGELIGPAPAVSGIAEQEE